MDHRAAHAGGVGVAPRQGYRPEDVPAALAWEPDGVFDSNLRDDGFGLRTERLKEAARVTTEYRTMLDARHGPLRNSVHVFRAPRMLRMRRQSREPLAF